MRILRFRDLKLEKGVGYSRVHLARLIKAGRFPPPIKLVEGGAAIGWLEEEIDEFIRLRANARDLGPDAQASTVACKKGAGAAP